MKSSIATVAGLFVVASAPAALAQGCPERLTDAWVAQLGPVAATRGQEDFRVYRPEGMRILGANVLYVVVDSPSHSAPKVKFRIDGRLGRSGELPRALINVFEDTYPGDEGCEDAPTFECFAYRERGGEEEGYWLDDVDLGAVGKGFSEFGGPWRGPEAALMQREQEADYSLTLTCAYSVR